MNQQNNNQPKQGQGQQQIKLADNIPGTEYTNLMQVSSTKDEFHLIFMNAFGPTGKVVGKIVTSPGHFKRMISAMQEQLKKYESEHGEVSESHSPAGSSSIGFEDRK